MNTTKTNQEVIEVLNDLIETCKDGEQGFRAAAEGVPEGELRTLFHMYGQQRARFGSELNNEVLRRGGEPATSGHVSAAFHRGWMNIKKAVAGKTETVIIDECEAGEDSAIHNYQDALKKNLPADLRAIVEEQFEEVKNAHAQIRAMKHRAHAAH